MSRKSLGIVVAVVAATATVAAVAQATGTPNGNVAAGGAVATAPGALQGQFASAAREFHVPLSVLLSVSYQETRWDSHQGEPSTTGNYNVMGLTQVDSGSVSQPTNADRMAELDQRGDGGGTFHPSKAVLADVGAVPTDTPALHTLDAAAKLIGAPAAQLRTDPRQSIRGGAALLADYQRAAKGALSADPARWYAAVARYSQSPDAKGADQFAQRVYAGIRAGEDRVTDSGQQVTLAADPQAVVPAAAKADYAKSAVASADKSADPAGSSANPAPECPSGLDCNFVPAAYKLNDASDPTSYGNYDMANRPADGDAITSIVIHDTESSYSSAVSEFQDPSAFASANYVIRSSDGLVTQMVPDKDMAWHAGNKSLNMHAIGIEHEGYAIKGASWYTESEYESSAALVKYLAAKYDIPLDRQHIIGHDDVPGPLDSYVSGMHWDPGTFWDWNHYMSLIGASVGSNPAGSLLVAGEHVRLSVPFSTSYEPTVQDCSAAPCKTVTAQPADFVYLRTGPSASDPLLTDAYVHTSGSAGTMDAADWSDKAVTGEDFVVAAQQGDWTAIWYGGREAWFDNPHGSYTVPVSGGSMNIIAAKSGASSIPVYGRTYPETSAYQGTSVPTQPVTALTKYTVPAGQLYVAGPAQTGDFYNTVNINGDGTGDRVLVTGTTTYYPIRYNHRIGYVNTADVRIVPAATPPATANRQDLIGRDSGGKLWQYQGTNSASAPYLSRYEVGTGWQIYNSVTALSGLHANGTGDVIARDTSGNLYYYQGSGSLSAPFKARVKVGTGWQIYNSVVGVGDMTGDGKADVVARDASGNFWFYSGTGTPTAPFKARVKIGYGYGGYNAIVGTGDVTGDGKADLIARDGSGNLWLYSGTGNAAAPLAARVKIGYGWQTYNAVIASGDVTGDGKADLLGRDGSGNFWLYSGTGSATAPYAARVKIGTGWQIYNTIV